MSNSFPKLSRSFNSFINNYYDFGNRDKLKLKNKVIFDIDNPKDYQAMSELMWCGSLSHNGITGLGAEKDFGPHKIGHELSAKYDVAHGASLSAIWKAWAEYVYMEEPDRFAQYARTVWGIQEMDSVKAACLGIEATVDFFRSIHMPVSIGELEIGVRPEEELDDMAARATGNDTFTVAKFKELHEKDILEILKKANY